MNKKLLILILLNIILTILGIYFTFPQNSAQFVFKNINDIIIGSEGKGDWGNSIIKFLITSAYPMKKVHFINSSNCDVIVRGVFTKEEGNWNSKSTKYIYWSGEPNTATYTKNLLRKNHLHSDILRIFTSKADNALWIPYVLFSKWLYKDRPKDCNMNRPYLLAYCNSNCVPIREKVFDIFVKLTSTDQCHAFGKCHGSYKKD